MARLSTRQESAETGIIILRFLDVAKLEARTAIDWYYDIRADLGFRFTMEFELALQRIKDAPLRNSRLEYYYGDFEVRRILLHKFPYAAIFAVLPTELVLVAVAHTSREPLYWIDRLKNLG